MTNRLVGFIDRIGNGLCLVVLRHTIVLETIHHTLETKHFCVLGYGICFAKTYHVHIHKILCYTILSFLGLAWNNNTRPCRRYVSLWFALL